jgi:ech hydrogenase subunit F
MPFFSFSALVARWSLGKPATRRYPFVKRPAFKATRGHIVIEIDKCIFCGMCQKRCPTDAIVVDKAKRTWSIDRLRCIQCRACVDVCPKDCLEMDTQYTAPMTGHAIDAFVQPPKPEPPKAEAPAGQPPAPPVKPATP